MKREQVAVSGVVVDVRTMPNTNKKIWQPYYSTVYCEDGVFTCMGVYPELRMRDSNGKLRVVGSGDKLMMRVTKHGEYNNIVWAASKVMVGTESLAYMQGIEEQSKQHMLNL